MLNFLVTSRLLSPAEADSVAAEAEEHGLSASELLLARGLFTGDELRRLEARLSGVPFISAWDEPVPFEVLARIPEPVARNHNVIAVRENDGALEVIGLDMSAFPAVEKLVGEHKLRLLPRLGSEPVVRKLLKTYQKDLFDRYGQTLRHLTETGPEDGLTEQHLNNVLEVLFNQAATARARRIHFDITPQETLVRYRIGSRLYNALALNSSAGELLTTLKAESVPATAAYSLAGLHTADLGTKMIFTAKNQMTDLSLPALGLWGQGLDDLEAALERRGIIFIGSEALSSRKNLFYAIAATLSKAGRAVAMVEADRERYLPHVHQVITTNLSTTATTDLMRQVLKQDVDVLIIDRLLAVETAALATAAAARGVTVVVGLEAKTTVDVITTARILVGDDYILAINASLFGLVEPVRALGSDSRPANLSEDELKDLKGFVNLPNIAQALADGAPLVGAVASLANSNWRTRSQGASEPLLNKKRLLTEILPVTAVMEHQLKDGKTTAEIYKEARQTGVLSLGEDALTQAAQGLVDLNEAIAVVRRAV